MQELMNNWTNKEMNEQMNECMNELMNGWMNEWMNEWKNEMFTPIHAHSRPYLPEARLQGRWMALPFFSSVARWLPTTIPPVNIHAINHLDIQIYR